MSEVSRFYFCLPQDNDPAPEREDVKRLFDPRSAKSERPNPAFRLARNGKRSFPLHTHVQLLRDDVDGDRDIVGGHAGVVAARLVVQRRLDQMVALGCDNLRMHDEFPGVDA